MTAVWVVKEADHDTGGRIPDCWMSWKMTGRSGSGATSGRVRDATGDEGDISTSLESCTLVCSAASRSALLRFFLWFLLSCTK